MGLCIRALKTTYACSTIQRFVMLFILFTRSLKWQSSWLTCNATASWNNVATCLSTVLADPFLLARTRITSTWGCEEEEEVTGRMMVWRGCLDSLSQSIDFKSLASSSFLSLSFLHQGKSQTQPIRVINWGGNARPNLAKMPACYHDMLLSKGDII